MIRTDADYVMATAGLVRALAANEKRRAQHLADYAENRVLEMLDQYAERRVKEIRAERRELRTEDQP